MNPAPRWLMPMTSDLAAVRSALQAMKPGYETTRYPAAIRMAAQALAAQPAHKKVLAWMADEQRLGWLGASFDQPLPAGVEILFGKTAPAPERQAAISSSRWIPDTKGGAVELSIRLYSPSSDQRQVEIRSGDTVLAAEAVTLNQNAENTFRLAVTLPPGSSPDGLKITMTPDDLPADDTAWVALQAPTSAQVLNEPLATGTDFIAHALGSTHKLSENPLEAVPLPASEWPLASVAILQGAQGFTGPQRQNLDRFVKGGGALWIFVDGSPEQSQWLAAHGVHVAEREPESDPGPCGIGIPRARCSPPLATTDSSR